VEPLAALTAPERTAAQRQSLLHLVAYGPWSDAAILTRVDEPNLQERSFAAGRWWLRELLFGLGNEPPEELRPGR
jgi:hypothetical protein